MNSKPKNSKYKFILSIPKNMYSNSFSNSNAQKTLIKLPYTQLAETNQLSLQIEHLGVSKSGLEKKCCRAGFPKPGMGQAC
jgi:hypothetical protein